MDTNQKFTTISVNRINGKSLTGLIYKNHTFNNENNVLLPYEAIDSIELTFIFGEQKINYKIKNKLGVNEVFSFLKSPNSEEVMLSDAHPLEAEDIPEDKIAVKIFNLSKELSPNGESLNLAFYRFIKPINMRNLKYSDIPMDTIFNINNNIPKYFSLLEKYPVRSLYYKAKVLTKDNKELIINGKKILFYLFITKNQNQNTFISYIRPGARFIPEDANTFDLLPKDWTAYMSSGIYLSR